MSGGVWGPALAERMEPLVEADKIITTSISAVMTFRGLIYTYNFIYINV